MRITFFILLLANLIAVLWHTQIQFGKADSEVLPEIPEEYRLVLVSEHNPATSTVPIQSLVLYADTDSSVTIVFDSLYQVTYFVAL